MDDINKNQNFLADRIAFIAILISILLVPIFFSSFFSFQFNKSLVVTLPFFITLISITILAIRRKEFVIPKNLLTIGMLAVPVSFLLSTLVSSARICSGFLPCLSNTGVSLSGYGFEVGTTGMIAILFLLAFIISYVFNNQKRNFYAILVFIISGSLVVLFQIIHFLLPGFTSFGNILASPVSNLVGTWLDLGFLVGSLALLSAMILEFMAVGTLIRNVLRVVFILSLILLVFINFRGGWIILGVVSLFVLLYKVLSLPKGERMKGKTFPVYLTILVVLAILSAIFFTVIGNSLLPIFNISYSDVRPGWGHTLTVTKEVLKTSPIFGVGPNRFANAWHDFKPLSFNITQFWSADFGAGVGLIPSFISTSGIVGSLSWLLFLVFFLWSGFKSLRSNSSDALTKSLSTFSFVVALYFWLTAIFYVPNLVIIFMAFVFTGLFFGSYRRSISSSDIKISLDRKSKLGNDIFKGAGSVVLAIVLVWTICFLSKPLSTLYFQKGVSVADAEQNFDLAEKYLNRAAALSSNDIYYQTLANITSAKISKLIGSATSEKEIQDELQALVRKEEFYAGSAVQANSRNYHNWIALGNVYQSFIPLVSGADAYNNAKASYLEAVNASPTNPGALLVLARLEASQKKFSEARAFINAALQLKPNFNEAVFLLSQIEVSDGNINQAITAVENASNLDPGNPTVYFQLGLLKYNAKNYKGAIEALTKAIEIISDYANAKYFRGLSYNKVGDRAEALKDFEDIKSTNPDNPEIALILNNLKAGKDPFAGAEEPIDNKPEKREELPVKEEI